MTVIGWRFCKRVYSRNSDIFPGMGPTTPRKCLQTTQPTAEKHMSWQELSGSDSAKVKDFVRKPDMAAWYSPHLLALVLGHRNLLSYVRWTMLDHVAPIQAPRRGASSHLCDASLRESGTGTRQAVACPVFSVRSNCAQPLPVCQSDVSLTVAKQSWACCSHCSRPGTLRNLSSCSAAPGSRLQIPR